VSDDEDAGEETVERKGDHVDIILEEDVQAEANAWEDLTLVHEALPEVDRGAVDPSVTLLGHRLELPVMVASMTGGYPNAEAINERLARAAAEHGVGMGVGSQRAMLEDPSQASTYTVVADHDVPFVAANIGAPQLIPQGDEDAIAPEEATELVEAIDADALIVHLNYLQEVVQPEGDTGASGVVDAVERLVARVDMPVIAKETGAGVHRGTVERLSEAGCAAVDVGGLSGTTFAAVERRRAEQAQAPRHASLGDRFRDWGVPTPVAVREAVAAGVEPIATGGLRNGLHVARALALGARAAGIASGALRPASEGDEALSGFLTGLRDEVETAMFLTGCETAPELREHPVVARGPTADWLARLGQDPAELAGDRL
jgi:isopentenyl-diphosphate delta-isomerase